MRNRRMKINSMVARAALLPAFLCTTFLCTAFLCSAFSSAAFAQTYGTTGYAPGTWKKDELPKELSNPKTL